MVEGDNVIDLQAADARLPVNLADVLAETGGDLKPLADLAKKAPASARVPLKGLKFGLPVARPPKSICLGLNYLEHVKEGFSRDNIPKFPTIFMRCQTSLVPHGEPLVRPKVSDTLDFVVRQEGLHRDNAIPASPALVLQRRLGARIPAQDHAVGHGQELRQYRRLRPLDGDCGRASARRKGLKIQTAQRPDHARTTPTT